MKRIFYILFISLTVISSFGFRGCELDYCQFLFNMNSAVFRFSPGSGGQFFVAGTTGIYNVDIFECLATQVGPDSALNLIAEYYYGVTDGSGIIYCSVGDAGKVVWSSDDGMTWENRDITGLTENLYGLDYFLVFPGVGVAVCGDSGIICISTDSGINWAQHNTITTNKLNSIMAYGGDNVVAVGDHGTIIKGGPQFGWEDLSVDPNINLYKIFQGIGLAYSKLWVVGSNGKIYYSSDYGESWSTQNSGVTTDLYDIKFRNESEGIIVGAAGVVRYTNNGGTTWQADSYFDGLTDGDIISVATVDFNTGIALVRNTALDGGSSTSMFIVSSEPLSADDSKNSIPSDYSLEQNYPNPFNPSTKINYEIPQPGFVTLIVYDVLGKEVATLVNEEKPAGSYEINFNASGLTSGIYFYKLQAGSFVETRKMVMLK